MEPTKFRHVLNFHRRHVCHPDPNLQPHEQGLPLAQQQEQLELLLRISGPVLPIVSVTQSYRGRRSL